MKAVVLAAGKGSRLYPVTRAVAKPLLPLANRMTIEYAFDRIKECGISEVCVVVGENEGELRAALGDGSAFQVSLAYARQDVPLGLAHAVSSAKGFVGGDDFLLYLGDAIYGSSIAPIVEQFQERGAANLNLVKEVPDPRRFGVATIKDDRIVRLVEKPQDPESNFAMAGLYVFGPQIWEVIPHLEPSARGEYEITDAIQLLVERGDLVVPGVYEGEWFDTGTLDSFLATSAFLTQGRSLVDPTAQIMGEVGDSVVVGPGARVECAEIRDAVVLPGATVISHGKIEHAIIGGHVTERDLRNVIRYGDLKE